jgi:isopentenyldiphosphate isomerase
MEFFDIYNADGTPAGYSASRKDVHLKGLWHRTVHIWVRNRAGDILLQKRPLSKEAYPGYWDISCAGHIDIGEESFDAALRELKEELGLIADKEIVSFLFSIQHEFIDKETGVIDKEFNDVYIVTKTFEMEELNPDVTEIAGLQFVKPFDLLDYNKIIIAPHIDEYKRLIDILSRM